MHIKNQFEDLFNSVSSQYITDSFRVFSINKFIHHAYFRYMNKFILGIQRMHPKILNIWHEIIFFTAFKGTLLKKGEVKYWA